MYAIIETGGKQYQVSKGDIIRVELLDAEVDSTIEIDKVLAYHDGKKLHIGMPFVEGKKISCKVLEHGKGKKIVVFRYKAKKNVRVKKGHRQPYTKLQIEAFGGRMKSAKKATSDEAAVE
jgi:large subunit ribosomal protein L21